MAKNAATSVLQLIHRLVDDPRLRTMTDQELLGRFRADRDEDAFRALVRRHGSMVFLRSSIGMIEVVPDEQMEVWGDFFVYGDLALIKRLTATETSKDRRP